MAPPANESFYSYEAKYGNFHAPEADILINGQLTKLSEMAISWVDVELTTDPKADVAKFCITNGYEWNPTKLKWIGSQIAVGHSLTIKLGYADKKKAVFDGIITGYTLEYPSDGSPNIIVTGMDRTFLMMKTAHSKVWLKSKVSDVVSSIASEYGLSPEVEATTIVKNTIEQIGVSDFHFLRSLASDHGRLFYVMDKKLYFKKPQFSGTPALHLKYGVNLHHFTLQVDVTGQTSEIIVRGYDVDKKTHIEYQAKGIDTMIGGGNKSGPTLAKQLSTKKVEMVYTQASSEAEAKELAGAMLERMARELVRGNGACAGIPDIVPGKLIEISGLGTTPDRQKLLLTKVSHRLDAIDGYMTHFEAEGNSI